MWTTEKKTMALKLLIKDIKPFALEFFTVVLVGVVAGAARSSPPLLLKKLLTAWEKIPFDHHQAFIIPIFIAGAFCVGSVCRYIVSIKMGLTNEKISLSLRSQLLRKYLHSSLDFLSAKSSGRGGLISRMLSDIGNVQRGFGQLTVLVKEPLVFLFTFSYMIYLNPSLTLIVFLSLPPLVFIITRLAQSLKKHNRRSQEILQELTLSLKETLDGSKVIRSFNLEPKMENSFKKIIDKYFQTKSKIIFRQALSSPLVESITTIVFAVILILIGQAVSQNQMSTPEFTAYIATAMLCTDAGKKIQGTFIRLQSAFVSRVRLEEVLSANSSIVPPDSPKDFPKNWSHIEFKNVSFIADSKIILDNISFKVKRGESLALVGQSGSGKTTIVNLLERFVEPTKGGIFIDEININEIDLAQLRSHISLVSQEVFLFHDTIFENIASGSPDPKNRTEIIEASKMAYADHFISDLPHQYDTLVNESGQTKLSGGERQRISIARALIKNSPILLLDEATSALDNQSERDVQKGLHQLSNQSTTSIIIAHRLSTIKNTDKILVLEHGQIIEQGSYSELSELGGTFKHLLDLSATSIH